MGKEIKDTAQPNFQSVSCTHDDDRGCKDSKNSKPLPKAVIDENEEWIRKYRREHNGEDPSFF